MKQYFKVFWISLSLVFAFKLTVTVAQFMDTFISLKVPREIANQTLFHGMIGTNFAFKVAMFSQLFLVAALAYGLTWYTYKLVDQVFFETKNK